MPSWLQIYLFWSELKLKKRKPFFLKYHFLISIVSFIITSLFLGKIFGVVFAIGYFSLLICHEFGHYIIGKKLGFKLKSFILFPFMANIEFKESIKNVRDNALIAVAGPIIETILIFIFLGLYKITGYESFVAIAFVGEVSVLLNIIPLSYLDGGKIVNAINPKLSVFGVIIFIILTFITKSPFLLVLLLIGIVNYFKEWKKTDKQDIGLNVKTKNILTLIYFILIIITILTAFYLLHSFNIKATFHHILRI